MMDLAEVPFAQRTLVNRNTCRPFLSRDWDSCFANNNNWACAVKHVTFYKGDDTDGRCKIYFIATIL